MDDKSTHAIDYDMSSSDSLAINCDAVSELELNCKVLNEEIVISGENNDGNRIIINEEILIESLLSIVYWMIQIGDVTLKDPNLIIGNTISVEGDIRISGGTLVFSNGGGTIRGGCVILESILRENVTSFKTIPR